MKAIVNGKPEEIEPGLTILAYLERRGINPKAIVVEHNGGLPPRRDWEKVVIRENDVLELVKFMGGV